MIDFFIIYYLIGLIVLGVFLYFDKAPLNLSFIFQILLFALVSPLAITLGIIIAIADIVCYLVYGQSYIDKNPIDEEE